MRTSNLCELDPYSSLHETLNGVPTLFIIIIIISLVMSPLLGHRPSLWITHKEIFF
jgi:ABC-type microcin C transport system permease subunit YejE